MAQLTGASGPPADMFAPQIGLALQLVELVELGFIASTFLPLRLILAAPGRRRSGG
jgi:hypothetical protein